jgi:PAS domain-containing protein
LCVGLSVLSYAAAHGTEADLAATLRLAVAIAAISITCALIIRNHRARLDLVNFNAALQSSEERYRTIFEQSRVALWERDYSEIRALLTELQARGIVDLRAYAWDNPNFIADCIARITTVAANAAALELLGNVSAQNAARCAATSRRTTRRFSISWWRSSITKAISRARARSSPATAPPSWFC